MSDLMIRWHRYIPVSAIRRVGHVAATLSVLPALVLSSLSAQAVLIHDHHGHDTHSHTLGVHELDEVQRNPEHQHEEHEHDGPTVDSAGSDGSSLVILMDLPEGLARGRFSSSSATAGAGNSTARPTNVVEFVTHHSNGAYAARACRLAPPLRAHSLLEGILLTSHALLL